MGLFSLLVAPAIGGLYTLPIEAQLKGIGLRYVFEWVGLDDAIGAVVSRIVDQRRYRSGDHELR